MKETDIDPKLLQEYFSYDPNTGDLRWKKYRSARAKPGDSACHLQLSRSRPGSPLKKRYIVGFGGKLIFVHRLIWAHQTGAWPTNRVDHVNRDPSDNRWCNLREATDSENNFNREFKKTVSGYKGVYFRQKDKKWISTIMANGKVYYLGRFDTKEDASKAHKKAAEKLHGQFSSYIDHMRPSGAKR